MKNLFTFETAAFRDIEKAFVLIVLLCLLVWGIDGALSLGIDPTDGGRWERSNLRYFKDHGTGKEYIAGPDGKLIERITITK